MRPKSWPLYDVWTQIFGKVRATGGVSEDIADGANALRAENAARYDHPNDDPSNDYVVNLDDLFDEPLHPPFIGTPESHHSESTGQTEQLGQPPTKTPKKRKADHNDVMLLEFLDRMHYETNKRLDVIAARIGYKFDLGQARKALHLKLGSVAGITSEQRYELCDILTEKPQRLEVFMGMDDDAKPGYVLRFIRQNPPAS